MLRDETFHKAIEAAVAAAEERTSAEIVVAMSRFSGSYRDTDYLGGALLAAAGLVSMLFAPFTVSEVLVLPYCAALFALGAVLCGRVTILRRWLTTSARRFEQARQAATLAFLEEGLTATRERNGLLIYLSLFENSVEIVPDLGIDGKVQRAEWNRLRHDMAQAALAEKPAAVLRAIEQCGAILATPFPPGADNPDEIPNRPRIRG
jgi:putative membrane protein